jgi:hypothetical protein
MRRDNVTAEEVEDIVLGADRSQPSIYGRTNYFRDYPDCTIRVTAIEEKGEFVIITVTRMRRK